MKAKKNIESQYSIEYIDAGSSNDKLSSSSNWLFKILFVLLVIGSLTFYFIPSIFDTFFPNDSAVASKPKIETLKTNKAVEKKQAASVAKALADEEKITLEAERLSLENKKKQDIAATQQKKNEALAEKLDLLNKQLLLEKKRNEQLNAKILSTRSERIKPSENTDAKTQIEAQADDKVVDVAVTTQKTEPAPDKVIADKESIKLAGLLESALSKDTPIEKENTLKPQNKNLKKEVTTTEASTPKLEAVNNTDVEKEENLELAGLLESALNQIKNDEQETDPLDQLSSTKSTEQKTKIENQQKVASVDVDNNKAKAITEIPPETPEEISPSSEDQGSGDALSNLLEDALNNASNEDKDYLTSLSGGGSDSASTAPIKNQEVESNTVVNTKENDDSQDLGNMLEEALSSADKVDTDYLSSLDQLSNDEEETTTDAIVEKTTEKVATQKPLATSKIDYNNAISVSTAAQIDAIMLAMQSLKQNSTFKKQPSKKKSSQLALQEKIDDLFSTKDNKKDQYESELTKESQVRSNAVRSVAVITGDTLWSIAKRAYGEGNYYKKIIKANPHILKNGKIFLKEGQILRVPK